MQNNRYYRKSTSITISNFYEQYQLKKYNMDPPYQRDMNVWDIEQKSFLIDTIFKNFPIPPIFLEQKINADTGITNYDVIDGKQRLTTIIGFIRNEIPLPKEFGNDIYGNKKLDGLTFEQIKELAKLDEEVKSIIADFWAYSISVEYIENPDDKVVDNIFDRLNREGSRLNAQELRKAQYYDSLLYNDIISYRNDEFIRFLTGKLKKNRLEDVSFITELFLMTIKNSIFDGNENSIDNVFSNIIEEYDEELSKKTKDKFERTKDIMEGWNIEYAKYNIEGVSHLYAIWYIALYLVNNNLNSNIENKLLEFFADLRGDKKIIQTLNYQQSMQSASRSKYARKKRVNALLEFLGFEIVR